MSKICHLTTYHNTTTTVFHPVFLLFLLWITRSSGQMRPLMALFWCLNILHLTLPSTLVIPPAVLLNTTLGESVWPGGFYVGGLRHDPQPM